jgi:hypothetical protein
VPPIGSAIEPERSISSEIEGVTALAVKLTAGQLASGPVGLSCGSISQRPLAVHV